jgi:hypothetical protein
MVMCMRRVPSQNFIIDNNCFILNSVKCNKLQTEKGVGGCDRYLAWRKPKGKYTVIATRIPDLSWSKAKPVATPTALSRLISLIEKKKVFK